MSGMYGCFRTRNSDSAAMASGPPDVMDSQETTEVAEECSGKKKSKFQTFKKFFARKKRKEPPAAGADAALKASQSSDNVSKTSENNTLTRSEKDKGSGSKISLGSKALSHDSVFVSDSSEANEALGASQDSIHGKVKSLQLQLKQAIKLGSPPSLMCVKRTEDAGTMSEDDGLPCSPPEYTAQSTALSQAQRNSSISLEGLDSDDDQLSCSASSRAVSPLAVPGDFSQPASPFGCLDNSAAKHKLGLRNKACNKRKPVTRLEMKSEEDSVENIVNTSITEAPEEQEQQKAAEVSADELKQTVDGQEKEEEEEDEDEGEEDVEKEQPQHSRKSLLRDNEEMEEGEDALDAEQEASHGPDTSSPPELCLSEEGAPVAPPSSKPSSRPSSLHSPRATSGPPAGPTEFLLDPPGVAYGTEENLALQGDEEDGVQENREEESSFLQEVLSSLKTPLGSCSLGVETEDVVQEIEEEVKEKETEDVVVEEGEEMKEEAAVDEPVSYQAAPSGSFLSDQTPEEEEEEEERAVVTLGTRTQSCQDAEEEEKVEDKDEAAAAEEEEVMEQRKEGGDQEAEDVKPEEQNEVLTENAIKRAEQEEESEGEEEAIELDKEPEVEEEGWEKREEGDEELEVNDVKEVVEEAEEAAEEEGDGAEEMMEVFTETAGEAGETTMAVREAGEDEDVAEDNQQLKHEDENPTELDGEETPASCQSFGEEREEEAEAEEGGDQLEDQEEDGEQAERHAEQEAVEMSSLDPEQVAVIQSEPTEEARAASKPSHLSLSESHNEMQDGGSITPTKTGTTTLHINLCSPSSEKATPFFQQSPVAAHPEESETTSCAAAGQATASSSEEEPADTAELVEEEKQSVQGEEATLPVPLEETANQLLRSSDQTKVRFTITPAWQRSVSTEDSKPSLTPPSSPVTCASSSPSAITAPVGVEVEAPPKKDPEVKAEPVGSPKVELVLSPGRTRSVTSPPVPNESSVAVEGNPDNPFGVRLRKTSVLHRFSSEEESAEPPIEPPAQPAGCKVNPPQPLSAKPTISQPVSSKPALPKKPDVQGDGAVKNKRISDSAAARGVFGGADSPSWISMAKQKQKIYKENSLEEITVKKEEQERKSSLPMYISSAVSRDHGNKPMEPTSKVSPSETSKPSVSLEKEVRRALSPPAPAPSQPPKSQSPLCPVPPKPQIPPASTKPPPQRALSPPTPVPVAQKSPSCTSPPSVSKPATLSKTPQPQSTTVTSPPPFSSRTTPEKPGPRAPGLSSQTPPSPRGVPTPALAQDEPPWMALAKKKAKAWSEMPQIVQ